MVFGSSAAVEGTSSRIKMWIREWCRDTVQWMSCAPWVTDLVGTGSVQLEDHEGQDDLVACTLSALRRAWETLLAEALA